MIDGRVFPEGANLVHHGQPQFAPHANGGHGVEHRRVGVNDVWPHLLGHLAQPARELPHELPLTKQRQAGCRARCSGSAIEAEVVNGLQGLFGNALLGGREVKGLPAQRPLLAQQGGSAKRVAAVQGDGVVENVKDSHK